MIIKHKDKVYYNEVLGASGKELIEMISQMDLLNLIESSV